jgi:hypothetical protein
MQEEVLPKLDLLKLQCAEASIDFNEAETLARLLPSASVDQVVFALECTNGCLDTVRTRHRLPLMFQSL